MGTDVYQPCPCGSGNKLKFCCLDIYDDMQKVGRLQEKEQIPQAHALLDKLETRPRLGDGSKTWILLSRATMHLSEGEAEEAEVALDQLLAIAPDHLLALALKASANFASVGYEQSKALVHRAFRKCSAAYPELVSGVAMGIAGEMYSRGKYLAAREHLTLAMRTAAEQERSEVFRHLLEFEGNNTIPYPLRSVHQLQTPEELRAPEESDEQATADAEEFQKALRRVGAGCWPDAAQRLSQLLERRPEDELLWLDLGYLRAFDGDEMAAAEALHKSAEKTEDFSLAVERECVAQILDLTNGPQREIRSLPFQVGSVSQLLSTLDDAGGLVARLEVPEGPDTPAEKPSGLYEVLTTSLPAGDSESLTLDAIPHVGAQLTIFSAKDDAPATLYVSGLSGDAFDAALAHVQELVGDELSDHPDETLEVDESLPEEYAPLYFRWHLPPKTSARLRRRLEQDQWQHQVDETWMKMPLAALGGKTPSEASGDESLAVKLMAAVLVLDSYCDRNRYHLAIDEVIERLGLPVTDPIEISEQTSLQSFSILRLHQVDVTKLDDRQLQTALNRALLVNHRRFLLRVLNEVVTRPALLEEVDEDRVYMAQVELAQERNDRDAAKQFIDRGLAAAKESDDPFQAEFRWKLREMAFLLEDPSDDAWQPVVKHVWDYYGPKLPQIRPYLTGLLESLDLPVPDGGLVGVDSGSGGLWTPGQSEGSGGSGKLILPD